MPPTRAKQAPQVAAEPPRWSQVLRALREARGLTQDGWALRLGVSRATVQRWEAGDRAPDPGAETAILAYCRESGLFRTFGRGPLAGVTLTAEALQDLLAESRLGGGRQRPAGSEESVARPRAPDVGPPPALTQDRPSNLPAPLTSFVGREAEIAAVRRALGGTRLLTLTGAGGCGKTRLALEVAGELLWAYPHGIRLIELAALADPALLPQTVAAALGVQTTDRPVVDALVDHLRLRHALLILDNCEHLVAAVAEMLATLLPACPGLEVLATSREALGLSGEMLWRVPPLSLPSPTVAAGDSDAVQLFVERARRCRPEFELTPENEALVVEVCRQLDGIPLAIELAAARLTVLSIGGIAERLGDRFRLLTGGDRAALPRQQTLRATLDWSWDLLAEPEQALLRRLSVFAGGFDLGATEYLCGAREQASPLNAVSSSPCPIPSHDVLDLLDRLVAKSLVVAEERRARSGSDGVRYRMLETVRQYAAGRLDEAGETAAVHERHAAWCLSLAEAAAESAQGPEESTWLIRLEEEHDNLRTALAWLLAEGRAEALLRLATALSHFWELRGYLAEGRQWLARALELAAGAPAALHAGALHDAGALAAAQGDYAAARTFFERGLMLEREIGDQLGIAAAQGGLGRVAFRQGAYTEARVLLEASLVLCRELGQRRGVASVQYTLGLLALRLGDHRTARAQLESSLALHRDLANKDGMASALEQLATVAGEEGDSERQAALVEQSLTLYQELGSRQGIADAQSSLGMVAWARGEYDRAATLLEEALALSRTVGDRRGIARIRSNAALVALYQRDYARAAAFCRESLALYRDAGDQWAIGRYLPVLAGAAFGQGRVAQAARLFSAAAALRERLGTPLPPAVQRSHDRTVAAARASLGEEGFTAAWAAGEAMSSEDAVAYALA